MFRRTICSLEHSHGMASKVVNAIGMTETTDDSPLKNLGVPAYRFEGNREEYLRSVDVMNVWLADNFQDLYVIFLGELTELLGERVRLLPGVSYPGFHIIDFSEHKEFVPGKPHTDLPSKRIPWLKTQNVVVGDNLTAVLPLMLPASGSGIEIYGVDENCGCESLVDSKERVYCPYREGEMFVFCGSLPHRPSYTTGAEGEHRITLQAHLINVNGNCIAFW